MAGASEEKASWRAIAQAIPLATPEESVQVAECVLEVVQRNDWTVVLTFLAMPGEVDLRAIHYVPGLSFVVTRTPPHGPLTIHSLTNQLEFHSFGYLQPREDSPQIDPASIDAVLVPGLLFATDGGRLGHGKGYYDRLLSSLRRRPYSIGVTVDRRVVEKLPMTDTDVYMDGIATESGFREAVACAPS